MDFRGLDLNLLVALDVLLEEKSITRTGERIHLCQSATSGVLARLREFFKDELLVQVGHRMVLTPFAEDLVAPVRELLLQAQTVVDRTSTFVPANSRRTLRIMLSDYMETVLLASTIRRIAHEAPSMCLELMAVADSAATLLERGEIDFLMVPESELSALHPSEEVFRDEYVCVVWSGNPLVGETITLEQYLNLGHIGIRFGTQRYQSWDDKFLQRHGYIRRVEVTATNFTLMPQLLVGTSRVATLHRRLATYFQQYLPLRIHDLPIDVPPLVEKLQWHKYRDKDPGHLWFRSILREEAAKMDFSAAETQGSALVASRT